MFWSNSEWRQTKQNAPGLNRGLLYNLWWLKSANHVKFTKESVMCKIKNIYKWAKQVFATTNMSRKDTDFLVNRKSWAQWSVKKVMKGPTTIDFLAKGLTVNSATYCQILWQYSILFIEWTSNILIVLSFLSIRNIHLFWSFSTQASSSLSKWKLTRKSIKSKWYCEHPSGKTNSYATSLNYFR